jgi:hypothetical protein
MNEPQRKGIKLQSVKNFNNIDFTKSNNFLNKFYSDLNLNEIKLLNTLFYIFSSYSKITKNEATTREVFKQHFLRENYFQFNYQVLLKLMNLKHTDLTLNEFEECLENIQSQKFKYIKMTENSTIKTSTTFLWKYQIIKQKDVFNDEIQKETTIKMWFDKELYEDIFNYTKIGYTTLNININKVSSKLGVGLYEELKRITNLKQVHKKDNKYSVKSKYKQNHEYTLEELNEICGTNFKYLTHIKSKIEIQYNKLLKLKLIDDKYKFYVENKKFYIDIVRFTYEEDLL